MNQRIKPILIKPETSIKETMMVIQKAPHVKEPAPNGIALIVDDDHRLLGIVTDGDIRRALLKETDINLSVENIMNRRPAKIKLSDVGVGEIIDNPDKKIDQVVVIDEDNMVCDVIPFARAKTVDVCIVGLGYVGLTLALTFADVGFKVLGVDSDEKVVDSLKKGNPHFHEIGIKSLLNHHVDRNFSVTTTPQKSDVYVISVDTPVNENGRVLTNSLESAIRSISKVLKRGDLIVLRSTVPVGTCREVVVPIVQEETDLMIDNEDFYVVFAPERTIEGKAIDELKTLPQIIGGYNKASVDFASAIFKTVTSLVVPVSSLEAAEMVKLLNNTFRDLSFAYSNEIAQLCDKLTLNSFEIINAANRGYPRNPIPTPSPGVGGACLIKDPYILIESAKKVNYDMKLPRMGREINKSMIGFVVNKVSTFCRQNNIPSDKAKIFIMGIAFKGEPETSDMRHSTSLDILFGLKKIFPNIFVYDSVIENAVLGDAGLSPLSLDEGFRDAHCVLVLNNHSSFKNIDIYKLLDSMKKPGLFFDGWGLFSENTVHNAEGVKYGTFGR